MILSYKLRLCHNIFIILLYHSGEAYNSYFAIHCVTELAYVTIGGISVIVSYDVS